MNANDPRLIVAMQLVELTGGVDVPDEQMVSLQVSALRDMANTLVPGINTGDVLGKAADSL